MPRLHPLRLGPFAKPLRFLRRQLPPLNFITVHYAYFFAVCLLSAIIFWGANTPQTTVRVSFADSLFLTVSAMTLAGLNTVNLSELNTFQQILLFLLIMLGSAIWVSAFVVHVRKRAFERKFADVIEARKQKRRGRSRSRSGLRSWSKGRRSTEVAQDVVVDEKIGDNQTSESNGSDESHKDDDGQEIPKPYTALDGGDDMHELSRDLTPPARRGGPEMNGLSSLTGDVISDSGSEPAVSPNLERAGITFAGDTRFIRGQQPPHTSQPARRRGSNLFNMQGVGARPSSRIGPSWPMTAPTAYSQAVDAAMSHAPAKGKADIAQYFDSVGGWIARNSQFHNLSEKEREKLGGYEYRAVSFLAWVVPIYFVLWQLLGCIGCAAWVALNQPDTARANGLSPWWVGAFNAVSAFNNSGMSLLDANMTAFQTGYYLLITMSLLILAGNTCYPIFLRVIVWCMWKTLTSSRYFVGEQWDERANTLRFLLDHPRRCYTNLFPSQHTWWLLAAVIVLNGTDWAAFEILNIHNEALNSTLPPNVRVIDGLFQAFAVRSGGFYVVSIPTLRISLQVLYVVMMYISVYPVVITMRNSNVYEERSLGIYAEDNPDDSAQEPADPRTASKPPVNPPERPSSGPGLLLRRALTLRDTLTKPKESNSHFVRHQLRAQLAHDAWSIVLALILIMILENPSFVANPSVFSVFNFLFEIVSAYGCVGISVGVPWAAYSFCGTWGTTSKLILCAVMLRGRHRGLPVAIDKAVLLPGREEEGWGGGMEEEDGRIRVARTMSRGRGERRVEG
ncbi:hypothetical protein LTR12_002666 [Friedmanniomyces endolithicus]|nr:hypothetical protein LTR12_002666 [Friedmanniomyces endolithicus]